MKRHVTLVVVLFFCTISSVVGAASTYCPIIPHQPDIKDAQIKARDQEQLIPVIEANKPILFLHPQETHFPISAEEYYTNPNAYVFFNGTLVFEPPITMKKLADLKNHYALGERRLYIDNPACVQFGSNPAYYINAMNELTTPAYVLTFEGDDHTKIYLQYIYLYGFYGTAAAGYIEHITLELDKVTHTLKQLYISSGYNQGTWLNPEDCSFEGTHPIMYVGLHTHGLYTQQGKYPAAQTETSRGKRWNPILIRIYTSSDNRFDPHTMGWIIFPGLLNKDGIPSLVQQTWFGQVISQ